MRNARNFSIYLYYNIEFLKNGKAVEWITLIQKNYFAGKINRRSQSECEFSADIRLSALVFPIGIPQVFLCLLIKLIEKPEVLLPSGDRVVSPV